MSKSYNRAARQSQLGLDEAQLVDFVKRHPIMHELNLRSDVPCKAETLWEVLAGKLNAPVDVVKKRWLNIKETYSRRKSLRSAYNLDFLPASPLELNDDSCTSSNCSSPKHDEKRATRSVSQLSTASESNRTNSTTSVSKSAMKQNNRKSRSRMSTPIQKDDGSIHERQSVESNIRRFQNMSSRTGIPRSTMPDSTFAAKEPRENDATTTTSKRQADTATEKNEANKHNAADSTRAFFESMAMTVSTFPVHIQAALKVRICSLIGDAEYELTLPKTM